MGFGGNQTGKIIGTGTVGNSLISINNVWLVDGLKHNLLSICQFCDNGYDVLFVKNNSTVINTHDQSIVFKEQRRNNVHKINFSELTDQKVLCLLSMSDKKWLWYRRLGHANWRLISKLSKCHTLIFDLTSYIHTLFDPKYSLTFQRKFGRKVF